METRRWLVIFAQTRVAHDYVYLCVCWLRYLVEGTQIFAVCDVTIEICKFPRFIKHSLYSDLSPWPRRMEILLSDNANAFPTQYHNHTVHPLVSINTIRSEIVANSIFTTLPCTHVSIKTLFHPNRIPWSASLALRQLAISYSCWCFWWGLVVISLTEGVAR